MNDYDTREDKLMVIWALVLAAMLFIPFPVVIMDVFARIQFILGSAILIYSFSRYIRWMPTLIRIYSGYSMALNVGLARLMIVGLRNGITEPQLSFMSGKSNGGILINLVFLVLFVAELIFLSFGIKRVGKKAKYYPNLNYSIRFLTGVVQASIFIVMVELAGGILVETYRNGKALLESITTAITLTTENIKLFLLSLVLVTVAIGFKLIEREEY